MVTLHKRIGKTGKVKSENGALYIGNFDENGVKTGLGRQPKPHIYTTVPSHFASSTEGSKEFVYMEGPPTLTDVQVECC